MSAMALQIVDQDFVGEGLYRYALFSALRLISRVAHGSLPCIRRPRPAATTGSVRPHRRRPPPCSRPPPPALLAGAGSRPNHLAPPPHTFRIVGRFHPGWRAGGDKGGR